MTSRPQRRSRGDRDEIERRAQEIADLTSEQIREGSGDSFWGGLGRGGWNAVKFGIGVLDTPRAVVTSTLQEAGDIFGGGDASVGDWLNQIADVDQRVHFRDWIPEDSWASRGFQGAAIGFLGDVGLDPLTYLGGVGLLARGSKGLAEAASLRRLGSSHITEASLHLAAGEGDTVARHLLKSLDDIDSGLLRQADMVDPQAMRHSLGEEAAKHLENSPFVARIDEALENLQRKGGGAASITDETALKAVFARSGRTVKNLDKSTGYRFRNPLTGTGYGPQLISQDKWSHITGPIRALRGGISESKYFRVGADRFGQVFRTTLKRTITVMANDPSTPKNFTRLAYQAHSTYVTKLGTTSAQAREIRVGMEEISEWMGSSNHTAKSFFDVLAADTVDAASAAAGVEVLRGLKTGAKGMGMDRAVGEFRAGLARMRKISNEFRPDDHKIGYVGENYIPIHWAEQVQDLVTHFRSRKIGKESPQQIFPEWMGETLATVEEGIERGVIRWDPEAKRIVGVIDPDTGVRFPFDRTAYHNEMDAVSSKHLGPDFESVIIRDPIRVALVYLEHHNQELQHWVAMKVMVDHGLGYWAETVGYANTMLGIGGHITGLRTQLADSAAEAADAAAESGEMDSLMKQAVNAVHTGQVLEWITSQKSAGAMADIDWNDVANVEMLLHKGVKNLVDDLHSKAFRTRQKSLEWTETLDERAAELVKNQRLPRKTSLVSARNRVKQIADGLKDLADKTDDLARHLSDPAAEADGLARQHNKILKAEARVAKLSNDEIDRIRKAEVASAAELEEVVEAARIVAAVDYEAQTLRIAAAQDTLDAAYVGSLVQRARDWDEVRGPALAGMVAEASDKGLARDLQGLFEAERGFARMVRDVPDQQVRSELGLLTMDELDSMASQAAAAVRSKLAKLQETSPSAHKAVVEQGMATLRASALADAGRRKHAVKLIAEAQSVAREANQSRAAHIRQVFEADPVPVSWPVAAAGLRDWHIANQGDLLTASRNIGAIWSARAGEMAGEDADRLVMYLEKLNQMNTSRPTASISGRQVDPGAADDVMGNLGARPQDWADYLEDYRTLLEGMGPEDLARTLGDEAEFSRVDEWITASVNSLWGFQGVLDEIDGTVGTAALHIANTLGRTGAADPGDFASAAQAVRAMADAGTVVELPQATAALSAARLAEAAKSAGKTGSFTLGPGGDALEASVAVALPGASLRHTADAAVVQSWLDEIAPLLDSGAVVVQSGRSRGGELLLQPAVVLQGARSAMEEPVALARAQRLADGWKTTVGGGSESMAMLRNLVPENPAEYLDDLTARLARGEKLTYQDVQVVETLQRRTIEYDDTLPPAFTTDTLESALPAAVAIGRLQDDLQEQLADIAMSGTVHTSDEIARLGRDLGGGVSERIRMGDIMRRDEAIDKPRVTRPDPYVTAKSAGLVHRPSGSQRGSLAEGIEGGEDAVREKWDDTVWALEDAGDEVEALAAAEARYASDMEEAQLLTGLMEEEAGLDALFATGVREIDLPKSARKMFNTHLNQAFRSKKGVTPLPQDHSQAALREWSDATGLTEKIKPFREEAMANRDRRIKGDAARAHQKALDEEAAMSQHARRRLHDEYLDAWETEKAADGWRTAEQLGAEMEEAAAARNLMVEEVDREHGLLMGFLKADTALKHHTKETARLSKKATGETKRILATVLAHPHADNSMARNVAEHGVNGKLVAAHMRAQDPGRWANFRSLIQQAADEEVGRLAAVASRKEARRALREANLQFSDALPDEHLQAAWGLKADSKQYAKLVKAKHKLVSKTVQADRKIRTRIAEADEAIDSMAARKHAVETIEALRPKALRASLTAVDRKHLEDAFVVFNKTKWATTKFEGAADAVPAARLKAAKALNDKLTGKLSPEERALIEKNFDDLVGTGEPVAVLRAEQRAGTEALLDTKAAGASLGIEPSRLALASKGTRNKVNKLAREALAIKNADRNMQGAVWKLSRIVEDAHGMIVADMKSQGLLDEAAEMSQDIRAIVSKLAHDVVEDASELARIEEFRNLRESSAQMTAYHRADALADGEEARRAAADATHSLNRAWADVRAGEGRTSAVNRIVAALDPDGDTYKAWKSLDSAQQVRQSSALLRILTETRDLDERIAATRHFLKRSDEVFAGSDEPERLFQQMTDGLADLETLADNRADFTKVIRSLGPTEDGDRAAAVISMGRLSDQDYAWTRVEEAIRHHPVNVAMDAGGLAEATADVARRLRVAEETEGIAKSLIDDYGFQLRQMHDSGFIGPAPLVEALDKLATGWNPGQAAKYFDTMTTAWRGLAISTHGFLVRNFQGGMWNNMISGHVTPKSASRFTKGYVQYHRTGHVADNEVRNVIEIMRERGSLYSQGQVGMDVQSVAKKERTWNPVKPFFSKGSQWVPVSKVSTGSAKVEDVLRGQMAFGIMTKMHGSVEARYATALAEIHKWHFDYTDLSKYDHNMRLVFPFWTWMSRNFSLQMRLMTERPQQALAADRLMENIGEGSPFNPYIPEWMNMARYVQVNQSTMVNIELPPTAVWRDAWMGNWLGGGSHPPPILGATNPLGRGLVEVLTKKDLFRGYKLEGTDYAVRTAENIFPLYARIHRLAVQPLTGDEGARQGWWWTALGVSGIPIRGLTEKGQEQVQQFEFPYRKKQLEESQSSPTELRLAEAVKLLRARRSAESEQQVRDLYLQMAREGFRK